MEVFPLRRRNNVSFKIYYAMIYRNKKVEEKKYFSTERPMLKGGRLRFL